MSALNKKKQYKLHEKRQSIFLSEKFENIILNLWEQIYMKVNLLVEFNTSVRAQINFSLVEFFM